MNPDEMTQGGDTALPSPLGPQGSSQQSGDDSSFDAMYKRLKGTQTPNTPVTAPPQPPVGSRASDFYTKYIKPGVDAAKQTLPGQLIGAAAQIGMHPIESAKALGRGGMKGVDEMAGTAVGLGYVASHVTGLDHAAMKTDAEKERFDQWYENTAFRDLNTFKFGDERRKAIFGADADGGVLSFVEGVGQFGVGMIAAGEILKPLQIAGRVATGIEAAGASTKVAGVLGRIASSSATGAIADMTAINQHADRISNAILENGPSWAKNSLTEYLANKADDTELEARLKGALEGVVLNSTMEGVLLTFKAIKVSKAIKAGKMTAEEGHAALVGSDVAKRQRDRKWQQFQKQNQEAWDKFGQTTPDGRMSPDANKAAPDRAAADPNKPAPSFDQLPPDHVPGQMNDAEMAALQRSAFKAQAIEQGEYIQTREIVHEGQQKWTVYDVRTGHPLDGEVFPSEASADAAAKAHNTPVFATAMEAENHAASMNVGIRNEMMPTEATPEFIDHFRELWNAPTDEDYHITLNRTGLNTQRFGLNAQQRAKMIVAAIDADQSAFVNLTRNMDRSSWKSIDNDIISEAMPWADRNVVLQRCADTFHSLDGIEKKVRAMQIDLDLASKEVEKLNTIAQANPNNAIAARHLASAMDTMLEVAGYYGGTGSRMGRGLAMFGQGMTDDVEEALAREGSTVVEDAAIKDPKVNEIVDALDEIHDAQGAHEKARENKDTNAVTATEVQLQRVWDKYKKLLDEPSPILDGESKESQQAALERAADIEDRARSAVNAGLTTTTELPKGPAGPKNPIMDLATLIDGAEKNLKARLENARKAARAKAEVQKSPVSDFMEVSVKRDKMGFKGMNPDGTLPGDAGEQLGPKQTVGTSPGFSSKERAPREFKSAAGLTRQEFLAMSRQIFMAEGDAHQVLLALRQPRRPIRNPVGNAEWTKRVLGYRFWAMLSSPKTFFTNVVAPAAASFQMPAEMWWGGVVTGKPEMRRQAIDTVIGLKAHFMDAWSMARKAYNVGQNILDVPRPELATANLDLVEKDATGVIGTLDKVTQAPTRGLMSTDEFYKQLNYRANLRGQILRDIRSRGITDPTEIAERLHEEMEFGFDHQGGAVNPIALNWARKATFTSPLEYGFGKAVQDASAEVPALRWLVPFVRTPTNIFRWPMERTPILGAFAKEMRQDIMAGGERRAMALGKQAFGLMFVGTAYMMAHEKLITGGGPSDPVLRRQLKDAQWKPYSIRTPGGGYISYRRTDPITSHFGLIADLVELSGEMPDDDHARFLYAAVASVAKNLSSKGFLQGAFDAMDAAQSGQGSKVEKFATGFLGSFIPNIGRGMDWDESIRETRSMLDEFKSRVPGFSSTLEPHRNVLGEKVLREPYYLNRTFNPMTYSPGSAENDVLMKLSEIGRSSGRGAISLPSETEREGAIDLTDRDMYDNGNGKHQSPYDRMLELMDSPENGGQFNIKAQLKQLMAGWDNTMSDGDKYDSAADLIHRVQGAARHQVSLEYPKLPKADAVAIEYNVSKARNGPKEAKRQIMEKYRIGGPNIRMQ